MDKVIDHLLVFKGEGLIEDFPGNYSDYRSYEDSKPHVSKKEVTENKSWKEPAKNKLSYSVKDEMRILEGVAQIYASKVEEVRKDLTQEKNGIVQLEISALLALNPLHSYLYELSSKLE